MLMKTDTGTITLNIEELPNRVIEFECFYDTLMTFYPNKTLLIVFETNTFTVQ